MNKIFLTQDGEVLRVQKRGQILLTLNAKENGNTAVAKRWEDVEDLRVTANIPNVSGIVRLPHTFDGSDMTIAAHYEWHDCNVMVIGNLGGVPFEYNIELKVDAAAAETTSAIVEVPALDAGGAGGAGGGMVEVTHAQLKAMRDAGQLVAGQQYRITDYVATTTDPESRSANHPFDIIVTADNERTLNESARAIAHAGDTYFEKCNLAAWKLMYCIDNDTTRFSWAQKGGEFYRINISSLGVMLDAELASSEDLTHEGFPYRFVSNMQGFLTLIYSPSLIFDSLTTCYIEITGTESIEMPIDSISSLIQTDGYGVVYHMIDEYKNESSYDFKGIQFKRYKVTAQSENITEDLVGEYLHINSSLTYDIDDFIFCYMIDANFDDIHEDATVGQYYAVPVENNVFKISGRLPNCVLNNGHSQILHSHSNYFKESTDITMLRGGRNNIVLNSQNWISTQGIFNAEIRGGYRDFVVPQGGSFTLFPNQSDGVYFEELTELPRLVSNTRFVALNSEGDLKVWNPADLVQ